MKFNTVNYIASKIHLYTIGLSNDIAIFDDTLDDNEFLHRYEDACNLEREKRYLIITKATTLQLTCKLFS